jgi:CheY-like chemotaxis protein
MRLYIPFILAFLVFAAVTAAQYVIAGEMLDVSLRTQSQYYHGLTDRMNALAAVYGDSGDFIRLLNSTDPETLKSLLGFMDIEIRIIESKTPFQEHIADLRALEIPSDEGSNYGMIIEQTTYKYSDEVWILVNAINSNQPIIKNLRDIRLGLIIILLVMVIFAIVPGALIVESLNRRWRLIDSLARVSARETELEVLNSLDKSEAAPCMAVSSTGAILYANRSCRRLLEIEGRSEEKLFSITSLPLRVRKGELLFRGDYDGGTIAITSMTGRKTQVKMEIHHHMKTGEISSCVCFFFETAPSEISNGTDVRSEDSGDRAQTSGSAAADMADTIIHQMNNQLSGILGAALTESKKGGGEPFFKIAEAAETLKGLFAQLRTTLAGDDETDLRNPLDELNLIADLMRRILPGGVEFRVSGDTRKAVSVRRTILRELVYNLALNSTSLMNGRGRIRVEVSDRLPESAGIPVPLPPDKWVCIRYSDGYIMPVALRDVFSSMNYALSDVERMFGSTTGSVYRILKQLGARVYFERGSGETVLCILIEGFDQGDSGSLQETETDVRKGSVRGLSVLVADDVEIVLGSTCEYLEHSGMTVTKAVDGDIAMELLASNSFDAAVLDMNMPGESTESIVRYCRTRYPEMAIVICTGYGMNQVIRELIKDPSTQCVHKPHRPEDLVEAIYSTLLRLRKQD